MSHDDSGCVLLESRNYKWRRHVDYNMNFVLDGGRQVLEDTDIS